MDSGNMKPRRGASQEEETDPLRGSLRQAAGGYFTSE